MSDLPDDARALCDRVRDEVQIYDRVRLKDGFGDDVRLYRPGALILPQLNWAISQLQDTGVFKTTYSKLMVIGTQEYALSDQSGSEDSVWIKDASGMISPPLERRTVAALDDEFGGAYWRMPQYKGRPFYYYFIGGSIGFYPTPDQAYTFYYVADTPLSKLVLPTDIIGQVLDDDDDAYQGSRLQVSYHSLAVYGAAWRISRFQGGDEARTARLEKEWLGGKEDLRSLIYGRQIGQMQMIPVKTDRARFRY